jgi:Nif-specific regulatory protein
MDHQLTVPSTPPNASREQLAALLEISRLLTSSVELDSLLHLILDKVTQLLQADGSSLLLVDPLTNGLVFQMPFGPGKERLQTTRLEPGQGVAGWVVKERKPLLVNDTARDPRFFGKIDALTGFKTESILAAPLMDRERVLGVIEVLNSKKATRFEQTDVELLTAFAVHATVALKNAQLVSAIKEEKAYLQGEIESRYRIIIGESSAMREAVHTARRVAEVTTTVLLLGESGVGKEIFARSIHVWSPRASKSFRAINCAAVADQLLESELFGHEKGAFTGAIQQKKGLFEVSHGGTLFLDEIGDMKPELQAKLLRVLEDRTFYRIGSTTPITVDVRIIAATNQDLKEAVRTGRFRKDLFYRLNKVNIALPSLRDRREDIRPLSAFFLERYCRELNRSLTFSSEALALLEQYPWPGNVRELENVIERAIVLAPEKTIRPQDLALDFSEATDGEEESAADMPLEEAVKAHKRMLILRAIAKTGSKTKAADFLKIQPTSLSRLCRQLRID